MRSCGIVQCGVGRDRELYGDRRARTFDALDGKLAAVQLDDRFRKRQAQSHALVAGIVSRPLAMEGTNDQVEISLRYANARVADNDVEHRSGAFAGDRHRAAGKRELDRIMDDVDEALLELCPVAIDVGPG